MTQIKQKPICAECNSADIEAHALLSWSDALQDWQIAEISHECNCADCGDTHARMKWISES